LPPVPAKFAFFISLILTILSGVYFYMKDRGGYLFSSLSAISFVISITAIISFISLYFYEMPTHHCPFCILQKEYDYIGYPMYLSLFTATVCGMGAGVLNPFRKKESLRDVIPLFQKRLVAAALLSYIVFLAISVYPMVFSEFKLYGY
ncbi:MAG: hypothetical protein Q7J70_05690, partial [Thermodesulfovibrionales bacterium]|nr:hypothetical protein [Thermodesulfovibrionales bacterium]